MKKIILMSLIVFSVFVASNAWAIPSLGVATGTYSNQDTSGQEYVNAFATSVTTPYSDGGFIWDGTEPIHVWAGMDSGTGWSDPGSGLTWRDAELFLVTNSAAGDGFTFNGVDFEPWYYSKQIDGYQRPVVDGKKTYYRVSLGVVKTLDSLTTGAFGTQGGEWYSTSGTLIAPGFQGSQVDWLFAVADFDFSGIVTPENDDTFVSGGEFSPKTTSAFGNGHQVPEPATMLLLGTGLIGLAGVGRKKFRKS